MLAMRAIFFGNVQGVGFRATARRLAEPLKVKLEARNLSDGTVEIIAEGEKKNLESLVHQLKSSFDVEKVSTDFYSSK